MDILYTIDYNLLFYNIQNAIFKILFYTLNIKQFYH